MPMLKVFDDPPFHCRSEFVDAFRQLLEAGSRLYAQPQYSSCSSVATLPTRPRCRVGPVRYYIIDFESAQECPEGKENAEAKRPLRCGTKTSPEFSLCLPCNPFKLDVYNAGATFFELCERYHGMDDLRPLLLEMMSDDPFVRPNMAEALRRLDELVSSKDKLWLRGQIWKLRGLVKPSSHMVQYLWRKFPVLLPYF
ncbi:uncharacterized protein BT62DRAFT_919559 [Guyanagaster necrorhizus]|uniref:Uncharacterized protein n=1 Tax=Guyanagaster necrorhizus TaxID=856835 RepID=A0A9P7VV06_9AGAR|nr:uncharacterized protein BT62DRAFT_919559 [Guyanagaster necrorhizus MCA 3950]KAG7447072.1 hypothetical protein BT62DRAFT_919559 [Guyanagaster necrorhizus MCA 3950]